ncbi:dihydroorotate dehydrogenase [Maridesulfovibrio salexigens]|uniref:Dihydroorotate dehydrogenase B (NAD(+)), catalytic subunit n=1 Tax=Maridesulfovibrio salexigens (strain ATCC 14822 / DSM 2638 / NCIMB 8403 / VKM B-1763) TaxID=526222 RepID=PYRDB_MARSD|nr:dihydroorotate dehydrogenase [Maridesulfovibrio salexigens]C6BW12.1 RecName: Full=Dihydroorotate dehydrogenase B (NAD(+)), catalytic subunit; Short=DHOD B; Short=DHODase B; Short=DHOdehase B; AltName: Full=Dihydroorotate oxidase B; AltName: Full=Orotate reductase (NADH) [Maridesulfovibrio salexigens DSM 2638]ACS80215.1 dihydroorotate dehydrogenase family protein [Maridesulfovibrio salexigens DSM 2638]
MDVSIDFAGLKLKNPILTASGTFGFGLEFQRYGDLESLGGIVVKGLSLKPREGNPMPRIAETPCGMLNAIGIQNPGVEEFINKKLPKLPWKTLPVLANLYATDAEEFGELAGVLAGEEGVAALEVNVSCPNVKEGGIAFGQDPKQITKVAEAVKKNAGNKPIIIKLSPNVTDITVCAKAAEDGGADALSLINTLSGMAVDIERRTPRLANVIGGLSGPAVKPVALRCVYQTVNAVKIPVMGLGGITTAEDAAEFLLVGAKAVQIGTGNFLSPDTAFRIAEELPKVLERVKAESLDEFIGSLKLPK